MHAARIGCVQYLNTLPLIDGLASWAGCELVRAVPSALIDLLRDGRVDVALVSAIDAARCGAGHAPVSLLPVGMIGCDGPTHTVRLFCAVPIENLTRVWADTESHTSIALLQVLFWRRFSRRLEVLSFDAHAARVSSSTGTGEAGWPEAVLLIGDKVVTDPPPAERYPVQLDLGRAWKDLTGLPFVYAMWMCRAGEEESLNVQAISAMLERARLHNRTRLDWIVASRSGDCGWPRDEASRYVGQQLRYEVGEPERESLAKFLSWASELGLCEANELRWVDRPLTTTSA